ncbi:MAG: ArnT family glycosyltransferase [Dysgonomonas sp.]
MRRKSFYLQSLYLQKPLLLIILIAMVATLPWIGLGDFYTKGEPREAALVLSMINDGNWIIPQGYADEFAYKPPLNHWLMAGFSYLINGGEVTPFTTRLPSVLAFIALIWVCFMFFARRRNILEAFVACLIMITCFELHRAAMTTRIDMLLTFFMVISFLQLFVWEEKKKNKYLLSSWLFLTLGIMVKGPVAFVLPIIVFGIYLLLQKYNFFKVVGKCLLAVLPALIIPLIWYYTAYQIKGDDFLNLVFAENFGRFLSIPDSMLQIHYKLGVENPWWYYVPSILAGFMPWTLLVVISLFFIKYSNPGKPLKQSLMEWWANFVKEKSLVYSLIIIAVMLLFFSIPTSKRSVYIMPLYPFVAIFMAQLFIYLAQHRPKAIRIYTYFLLTITSIIVIVFGLIFFKVINLEYIGHLLSQRERTIYDFKLFSDLFQSPTFLGIITVIALINVIIVGVVMLRRRANVKLLMTSFAIVFFINIFLDGFILPGFKNGHSSRPFAEYISSKYDLKGNTYVHNNLLKYGNMYGLNFYLGNNFKNFEKENPDRGYFICDINNVDEIIDSNKDYNFVELETSEKYTDYGNSMVLFSIQKIQ